MANPREAITDTLYRALQGFDRNDVSLFEESMAGEDVSFELNAGEYKTVANSLSEIRAGVVARVGPMITTHMISNVCVEHKDGASTASLTAYALAQHCLPGKGLEPDGQKLLAGAEYLIDLVKDEGDGSWKIKKWVVNIIWRQGDASIMG